MPYTREDYGTAVQQHPDRRRIPALNPNAKVPTLIDGDIVIWESNTILRYLAALHAPALTGATPAEKHRCRALDGLAARRAQYALSWRCSRTPRTQPESAAPTSPSRCKTLDRAAEDPRRPSRQARVARARQAHHRRHRARADRQALPRIPDRAPRPAALEKWQAAIAHGRPSRWQSAPSPASRRRPPKAPRCCRPRSASATWRRPE